MSQIINNNCQVTDQERQAKIEASWANNLAILIHASSVALTALVQADQTNNVHRDVIKAASEDLGAMISEAKRLSCTETK